MSLTDFWNNITTPGFLAASFDELKELIQEIKAEAQELVEEGEELFTDGFKEMVLQNNDGYKTSATMRTDGQALIDSLKYTCLEARGFSETSLPVIEKSMDGLLRMVEALREFEEPELKAAIESFRNEFDHLIFALPADLELLQSHLAKLLIVPIPPVYSPPPSGEKVRQAGPVALVTSDKQKRKIAAVKYLSDINKYTDLIELETKKQSEEGPLFNSAILADYIGDFMMEFDQYYWSVCSMYNGWSSLMDRNSTDVKINKKKKMCSLLMLAAGIYTPLAYAANLVAGDNQFCADGLLEELRQVVTLTKSLVGEDEKDTTNQEEPDSQELTPWKKSPWLMSLCGLDNEAT